jgi:hypothetical protein
MPRHKFQVTDEKRQRVKKLAGCQVQEKQIALLLGLRSVTALRKYFGKELVMGSVQAKANVSKTLVQMARSGEHPAATMFWLKTRAGWSEKGNRPEPATRDADRNWLITEYQPPSSPEHEQAFEEAVRRLRAASGGARPEWEGDKGDEEGEEW